MSNSLNWAGLELVSGPGGTYNVVDEGGSFGDPQKITAIIRSQLTSGSFETGSLSDNRSMQFQIFVMSSTRLGLSQACSDLLAVANTATPQQLTWTPDGCPATVFDTFRGQATTTWSGKFEAAFARIIQVQFAALPFGRSDTQRAITGSVSSVQILDFSSDPEYTYHVPSDHSTHYADLTLVPYPTTGTAYDPQTTPAPLNGDGCMRVDTDWFRTNDGIESSAKIGPVTVSLDLSDAVTASFGVWLTDNAHNWNVTLTLKDSSAASQNFAATITSPVVGWQFVTFDLSAATIDLSDITAVTLYVGEIGVQGPVTAYLGSLDGFPASSTTATTSRGAVYKLSGVLGDATADATVAFDRGGTNTISGFLAYRAPSGTTAQAPALIGLTSNTGSAAAPALFNGTYRVVLANGGSTITAGTLTVTQKIGSTTVASTTVSIAQVSGATKWGDGGDLTLPLVDVPADASNVNYTFSYSQTATDLILADTAGFLRWVPALSSAVKYVWIDEATAAGAGGVWGSNASDRTDATSLLGQTQVQPSGTPSLDPGDNNYLLLFCLDGAPTNITVSYYDRYLGERTAA